MPTPDEFTGERFLPECTGEIWAEHWHRYHFAARFVAGKDVLDAACGEGYGAAWLARHARSVTGLDIDPPTVAHARARYVAAGLRFEAGSVAAMPFADSSFDYAISFETLEHLAEQEAMLAEFRRVLRPSGVLIISTPNKTEYTDKRGFHNEFHVRELYEAEFRALLAHHFGAQRWYGQRLLFNSALWPLGGTADAASARAEWVALDADKLALPPPMYFVALVAADASLLPATAATTLLTDPDDAMFHEYTQTVLRATTLEKLVGQRESIVVERDRQLAAFDERRRHMEALIAARESLIAERDRQLAAAADRSRALEDLVARREQLIVERDAGLQAANGVIAQREALIVERDRQLAALNARIAVAEQHIATRDNLIVERDAQLTGAAERQSALETLLADRERIIVERDAQLAGLATTLATAERLIAEREALIVERDGQLAGLNDRLAEAGAAIAERERLIAERDALLATANATIATAEKLIAERERIIVERDGQLAAVNARIAEAEAVIAERTATIATLRQRVADLEQGLAQRDERLAGQAHELDVRAGQIEALTRIRGQLQDEVARRAGWRWWLALPYLRLRRMLSPTGDTPREGGP